MEFYNQLVNFYKKKTAGIWGHIYTEVILFLPGRFSRTHRRRHLGLEVSLKKVFNYKFNFFNS